VSFNLHEDCCLTATPPKGISSFSVPALGALNMHHASETPVRPGRRRRYTAVLGAALVALALLAVSCAGIRWISDYDEETDQSLTAIQQKTDDFIVALEKKRGSAEAGFDKNAAFYEEIDRALRQLEFRVGSIPKNDKSVKLVGDIRTVIVGKGECSADGASLRDLHCLPENKAKGPSVAALEISRRNINQTISAALQLELAKKQGTASDK